MTPHTPSGSLRVSGTTGAASLAKSLSLTILERDSRQVTVRGIGPAAAKVFSGAWELARAKLQVQGYDLVVHPGSEEVTEGGKCLTVLIWECTAVAA